jgi:signal transduction histidine kinase
VGSCARVAEGCAVPLTNSEMHSYNFGMRLPDFILQNMEAIVAEWETFAATLYPARYEMTSLALRDHVKEIMAAVAADIRSPQSKEDQAAKSKGLLQPPLDAPETAAQTHAVLRAQSGLDINQLASEYRALRASVLRLWQEAGSPDDAAFEDMIRFNEAIDQALAESIAFFAAKVNQSRNLLLGALGHDMRSPLQAILLTAHGMKLANANVDLPRLAECLIRSGAAMQALLDDLVDFNRTNLGLGISIDAAACDFGRLCAEEVEQQRAAHPGREIQFSTEGDLCGYWDGRRLQQVVRNLVTNAIAYGAEGEPVRVQLSGEKASVSLVVANRGPAIDPMIADRLFDPLKRGDTRPGECGDEHLGIGLYIVREISVSHGGTVQVHSAGGETAFTVCLPRQSRQHAQEGTTKGAKGAKG